MKLRVTSILTNLFLRKVFLILVCSLSAISNFAQDLPDKIRGYKVHKTEINVRNSTEKAETKSNTEAVVMLGEPEVVDVSLNGITLEISAELDALEQSGKVDFLTFNDFRVNGLTVEIEEYKNAFEFKKNQLVKLPKPARIFLRTSQTLRGALKELDDPKEEWLITGRVFVFGKFKKYGFSFKRVIPVEINLKIKNPLRQIDSSN